MKNDNQVISCGGGVISSPQSMNLLGENANVVFLHAHFETIKSRLKNTTTRPLFRQEEKAMLLYAQRLPLYQQYAGIVIETDNKSPEEISKMIIQAINAK